MSRMKLKELRSSLQDVEAFDAPKILLEQYPTSPEIAAHVLYAMEMTYDDVDSKAVVDLGCGCGMLSIAAAIMGADTVIGVELDEAAIAVARRNIDEYEVGATCFVVQGDVRNIPLRDNIADTVVMNPPFGTKKNKGIDVVFLEQALRLAPCVYSLHKTSTRAFLERKCTREWNCSFEVVAELRFDIPNMYACHKKKSVDVRVDFIRIEKNTSGSSSHHG
eukprot:TRINITY_DN4097_c0_g1_i1.p1 TRINITY_DN4097_c0_g1~~TRINITY_DN4097_c0_g1_i1.p1  ORF type:complete len:220 (-),score=59.43 TRINITY_DN4097_c0_g1_i1:87-746(-)